MQALLTMPQTDQVRVYAEHETALLQLIKLGVPSTYIIGWDQVDRLRRAQTGVFIGRGWEALLGGYPYIVPTVLMEFTAAAFNAALSQLDAEQLRALEAASQRA